MKGFIIHLKRGIAALLASALLMSAFAGCDAPPDEQPDMISPDWPNSSASSTDSTTPSVSSPIVTNNTFGVAIDVSGGIMNPLTTVSDINLRTSRLIYDSLFTLAKDGTPEFSLCRNIELSEDRLSAMLWIKSGVNFHDGSPLTADDAAYSITTARDSSPIYSARLSAITSVSSDNSANTVTLAFSRPCGSIAALLDMPIISSRDSGENNCYGGIACVGSGKYYVDPVTSENEIYYFLQYNSDWPGYSGEKPMLPRLDLIPVKDLNSLIRSYDNSDIDMLARSSSSNSPANYTGDAEIRSVIGGKLLFLGINKAVAPFQNASARLALSHFIDRADMCAAEFDGLATPAYSPVHPENIGYDERFEDLYGYNIARGDFLMSSAGMEKSASGAYTFVGDNVLLYNSDSEWQSSAAQYVARALEKAGLHVVLTGLAWDAFAAALSAGQYTFYIGFTNPSPDFDYTYLLNEASLFTQYLPADDTLPGKKPSAPPAATPIPEPAPQLDRAASAMAQLATADIMSAEYPAAARKAWRLMMEEARFIPLAFDALTIYTRRGFAAGITPARNDIYYNIEDWTLPDAASDVKG